MSRAAIFGAWGSRGFAEIDAARDRLRHRGDYEGIRLPGEDLLLGWRGDHPRAEGGLRDVPLVCACKLLNRESLEQAVGAGGGPPLTDAELLWQLYRLHGPRGFALVNGSFSLALYDADAAELVLAVDSWATRPLYFTRVGEGYALATEYKALLAMPSVDASLNLNALAYLQATKYLPPGEGLFETIRPLAPGTWARLHADGWETDAYDAVALDPDTGAGERALAADLQNALLRACERLVEGCDSVGILLSAGLDSTCTVGAVRAVAPDVRIHTFTAGFDANDPQLARAAETARYFDTVHHQVLVPVTELPELVPELVRVMEDPVAREEMIIYYVLAREASGKVPFLLHGQLADMLFGGMPRHTLVRLASETPVFRQAAVELYDYSQSGIAPRTLAGKMLVRAYYRKRPTPPPRVLGAAPLPPGKGLNLNRPQPLNELLLDSLAFPTEIGCLERIAARWKLGCGSPFHDLDLVRCAFRVPDALKVRGLKRKYILRRAVEGILPPELASRPKDLLRMPRGGPLKEALGRMAADWLSPEQVLERGLFDPREVASLVRDDHPASFAYDRLYHLWTLLLTECWLRSFADGRANAPEDLAADLPLAADRQAAWTAPLRS